MLYKLFLELETVLKKRRLAAGVENQNPLSVPLSPDRLRQIELAVKPDTPAIASVRLRVQQLTQRRDGKRSFVSLTFFFMYVLLLLN